MQSLYVYLSRSTSSGDRFLQQQLGQVGLPIPISPDTYDFEGFSETENIKIQKSFTSVPRTSRQSMVPKSTVVQQGVSQNVSSSSTSSQRPIDHPRTTNEISRLQFIREHYSKLYPRRASEVMSLPIRQSSCKEYENKWKKFLKFLNQEGIELRQCTLNNVLEFFTMLFDKKGLLASSIAHYRSALSVPLRIVLKIDFKPSCL